MSSRLTACVCLAALAACSAPAPPVGTPAVVFVAERGWHTDITLPVEEITGPLVKLEQGLPGLRFLTFGFGERQFLVDRRKNFGAMLNALLPSKSALLLTALRATPAEAYGPENVVTLHVTQTGLERIEASLWREFEKSASGQPMLLAGGPYPGSSFYAANDTYSALFTCNTWTATILRSGGIPVPASGLLFAGQVMGAARWIALQPPMSP